MDRAVAPTVGVVLLVAITIVAASAVASVAFGAASAPEPGRVSITLSVEAAQNRVTLVHEHGDVVNVTRLSVRITVEGERLAHQPPVPFFAATGFLGGPGGPFNSGADPHWSAGERATLRIASTNDPTVDRGDLVGVTITRTGRAAIRLEARAT